MYVLPSDVEGMPISLLEAMACGCECLVSDIDTAKNVVGEYGYTFKKSDVNDCAKYSANRKRIRQSRLNM